MRGSNLRVTKVENFRDYWDKVRRTVAGTCPKVSVGKWEQEDVNFELSPSSIRWKMAIKILYRYRKG